MKKVIRFLILNFIKNLEGLFLLKFFFNNKTIMKITCKINNNKNNQ